MSDATFDKSMPERIQEFTVVAEPTPDLKQEIRSLLGLNVTVEHREVDQEEFNPALVGSANRLARRLARIIAADPDLTYRAKQSLDDIVVCFAERNPAYEIRDRSLHVYRSTQQIDAQRCSAIANELFPTF